MKKNLFCPLAFALLFVFNNKFYRIFVCLTVWHLNKVHFFCTEQNVAFANVQVLSFEVLPFSFLPTLVCCLKRRKSERAGKVIVCSLHAYSI